MFVEISPDLPDKRKLALFVTGAVQVLSMAIFDSRFSRLWKNHAALRQQAQADFQTFSASLHRLRCKTRYIKEEVLQNNGLLDSSLHFGLERLAIVEERQQAAQRNKSWLQEMLGGVEQVLIPLNAAAGGVAAPALELMQRLYVVVEPHRCPDAFTLGSLILRSRFQPPQGSFWRRGTVSPQKVSLRRRLRLSGLGAAMNMEE